MSVILLIVGIVVTGAGLAALGFGIPINEFSLGTTLITAGTTALCSGLILIGLSAAVAELRRVGDLLKSRPLGQPPASEAPAAAAQPSSRPPFPSTPAAVSPPTLAPARRLTQVPAPAGYAPAPSLPRARLRRPSAGVRHAAASAAARGRDPRCRRTIRVARSRNRRPPRRWTFPPRRSSACARASRETNAGGRNPRWSRKARKCRCLPTAAIGGAGAPRQPRAGARTAAHAGRRLGGAGGEAPKSSRLDFLFRARQATQQRPENFDPRRPARRNTPGRATGNAAAIRRDDASARASATGSAAARRRIRRAPAVDTRPREPAPRRSSPPASSSRAWSTGWPIRSTPTARSRRSCRTARCGSARSPNCARISRSNP